VSDGRGCPFTLSSGIDVPVPAPGPYRPLLGIYTRPGFGGWIFRLEWRDGNLAFTTPDAATWEVALAPTSDRTCSFQGRDPAWQERPSGSSASPMAAWPRSSSWTTPSCGSIIWQPRGDGHGAPSCQAIPGKPRLSSIETYGADLSGRGRSSRPVRVEPAGAAGAATESGGPSRMGTGRPAELLDELGVGADDAIAPPDARLARGNRRRSLPEGISLECQ
jgi:hypothetical protein